jgi:hypothetical protein
MQEKRFSASGVFYFAAETRGCIVRLVFNDVDRRKRQFTLNKIDDSSHLQH